MKRNKVKYIKESKGRLLKPHTIFKRAKNWNDFEQSLESLQSKDKGDCFELLSIYLLQFDPKYESKIEEVWPVRNVPKKIRIHLQLPATDEGIDLVCRTVEGGPWLHAYIIIQRKQINKLNKKIVFIPFHMYG